MGAAQISSSAQLQSIHIISGWEAIMFGHILKLQRTITPEHCRSYSTDAFYNWSFQTIDRGGKCLGL